MFFVLVKQLWKIINKTSVIIVENAVYFMYWLDYLILNCYLIFISIFYLITNQNN